VTAFRLEDRAMRTNPGRQLEAAAGRAECGPSAPPKRRRPLHERIRWLGSLRRCARGALFGFLRRLASTDDARAIQVSTLRDVLPRRPSLAGAELDVTDQPYADLGTAAPRSKAVSRDDVVLITARFRSGSTLLWNLFRHVPGCTAYYEPFNERRWFDPSVRGNHTDPTHRQVEEYWQEYQDVPILGNYYQECWTYQSLFMDADSWDPAMKRYVEILIDSAAGRPVLQFNRIDFRLPWFRRHFPLAKVVHLYRHPRDQWCSSLVNPAACPPATSMKDFAAHDHYYLRSWAQDLRYQFPFLDESRIEYPYRMFYYLWKLSYLFGSSQADYSLAFEELVEQPVSSLKGLFRAVGVRETDLDGLRKLIDRPQVGRWRKYAGAEWFQHHEAACERVLGDFFGKPVGRRAEARAGGEVAISTCGGIGH
jgi:hypothetical protein